jgi:hypothetical protein
LTTRPRRVKKKKILMEGGGAAAATARLMGSQVILFVVHGCSSHGWKKRDIRSEKGKKLVKKRTREQSGMAKQGAKTSSEWVEWWWRS